ncbi:MAG: alpha/beta hydrolase [Gammaproteobacteria bacterium]|nr:alpha/beta hydrolase [Gammaproteobacteria bacterium]
MKTMSLVLLPGLDGTGKLFASLIGSLPAWITPVVVSYPTDEKCDYQDLSARVAQPLPADTDFVILGESFAGPLAVMAAAQKPSGLRGIILCASFVKNPFKFIPSWARLLSVGAVYQLWPATIRIRARLRGPQYKDLANAALDAIKTVSPDVIAQRVKCILTVNVEQTLIATNVPILYLAGRKDWLIRKHNASDIKAVKPELRVTEIDTQHFVLQLEPEKSAAEIERFMLSVERAA